MAQPISLPVFILEDAVLFPGALARLETDEDGTRLARSLLASGERQVVVAHSREPEETGGLDVHAIATLASLEQVGDDGGVIVSVRDRVRVLAVEDGTVGGRTAPVARIEPVAQQFAEGTEVAALAHEARRISREILALLHGIPAGVQARLDSVADPAALADLLAHYVPASAAEKQRALETLDPVERLQIVIGLLARRRELLQVAHRIEDSVQEKVSHDQREHLLRRKLAAIQAELGEGKEENEDDSVDALEKKILALGLPEDVLGQVTKELARLRKLPESSPERSVSRTWLQLVADLPWAIGTEDNLDVENARGTLEADHHGLGKVKQRVLQFLAVRKLRGDLKGPLLCLVGPPGVGKTSLGKSIARAMGRKFVRVSLGGVRDEAEIRGHRRTYVGAFPGRLVQALKRAGSNNPVVMLDEIDKLSAGARGDPSAALLEVLDAEQNKAFVDHYLEVPVDLSKVLFIATANSLETVPAPLRDRMEILEIPSYTLAEKQAIARTHLLPKQLQAHGLSGEEVTVTDAALVRLAQGHTREAGVRALEKRLADVCRALAVEKVAGTLKPPRTVDQGDVETLLGPDLFDSELRDTSGMPGVAAGLAWTPVGGVVLYIEALKMPGRGQLMLTGQLGEVMRESAKAAMSYLKSNASALGLPATPLDGWDVHVHLPAGATPKDGPSAGVTLFTALVSLFSGIPMRSDTAMSGEATLRGRVLPVGGIKEKVLAAHRMGLRRIILPIGCKGDLRDIPQEVRDEVEIVLVSRMEEALEAALVTSPLVPQLRAAA